MQRHCFSLVAIVGFAALLDADVPPRSRSRSARRKLRGPGRLVRDRRRWRRHRQRGRRRLARHLDHRRADRRPPFGTHIDDGSAIAAQSSTTALYTRLAGTGGATPLVAALGGTTLIPGIYSFTSTANIAAGTTLTLNGSGVYIFKVGSAITANVGSRVVLTGGATPCNVFWQVTSAATLNGANFAGTVVAQAGVTLGVGAGAHRPGADHRRRGR